MRMVFVAGPYRGASDAEVAENVRRACAVAAHATRCGLLAFSPHAHGFCGVHGDPSGTDTATEEVAIRCGRAWAAHVGTVYGRVWIIERDDHTLSAGTAGELGAFMTSNGDARHVVRHTWPEWEEIICSGVKP
jgi:hypothetical protein